MISYLKGIILFKNPNSLVINVNGIGYEVFVSINILSNYNPGSQIEIFTYHNIKEDAQDLFGFKTADELGLFKKLITVSGVGPKTAMSFFSVSNINEIENAIANEDITFITRIPGIGKKTAERIVLELKNKISASLSPSGKPIRPADNDVIDALVGLGYNLSQAREAVAAVPDGTEKTEEKIKAALKALNKL